MPSFCAVGDVVELVLSDIGGGRINIQRRLEFTRYVNELDRSEYHNSRAAERPGDTRESERERERGRYVLVSQVGQLHIGSVRIYGDFIICESTIISWIADRGE